MAKVVVTGASGNCGRVINRHLAEHGFDVLGVDVIPPDDFAGPPWAVADLSDFGQTVGVLEGANAVVHFGAIPGDGMAAPSETFRNNLMASFNVLEACRRMNIKRIVVASSIEVHATYAQFQYVPVDEAHPVSPQAAYGLAKFLAEQACDVFSELADASIASFRLPRIMHPDQYATRLPGFWENPKAAADCLWTYIDGRDVAQACRLAIQKDLGGHEIFWLSADTTHMKTPTRQLLSEYRPDITDVRVELPGLTPAISDAKIRRMLGFTPKHRWEDHCIGN